MLPEDCVSTILSLISPIDVCNSSLLSKTFWSAGNSDSIWKKFLPDDYVDIISRSINPMMFSSKKQVYQFLCDSILIDNGKKFFKIEKSSGKICYILSARELSITWGNSPLHWAWHSRPESRFSEVAELRTTDWLEIQGKIRTTMLSTNTNYGAYLVIKILGRAHGLDLVSSEIFIKRGNKLVSSSNTYVNCEGGKKNAMDRLFYTNRARMMSGNVVKKYSRRGNLEERKDGWMEIELGEFFNGESDEELKMGLMEVKGYQLKGGIVVEGIEVRPKN